MTCTTLSRSNTVPPLHLLGCALLMAAILVGCSDSKDGDAAENSVETAAGAAAGKSGGGGNAGESAFFKRRAAPGEQLPSDFSLMACPGVTEEASATSNLSECGDICGGAHCVEAEHAGGVDVILPDCKAASGGAGKCIPDKIIQVGGKFVYKTCDADGAPGVCVPDCLILDAGAIWLLQKTCNVGELCVTCDQEVCGDRCAGNYPTFRP